MERASLRPRAKTSRSLGFQKRQKDLTLGWRRSNSLRWLQPKRDTIVTDFGDAAARIWDAANGKQIATLLGHMERVLSAGFSPDGKRIVTGSDDDTTRIWDAATGRQIAMLPESGSWVRSASFSPDGKRILTAFGSAGYIWDATTGNQIAVFRGHGGSVNRSAFSPDGKRILTASDDKTARIWDATTGSQIAVLRGNGGEVYVAAFSPDGTRVATASRDGTVRIWDADYGNEIATVVRGNSAVSVAFGPDGTWIVTASASAAVRDIHFAMMHEKDLVNEVCMRRMRGLTVLSREEMRLAGYRDDMPMIDVCDEIECRAASRVRESGPVQFLGRRSEGLSARVCGRRGEAPRHEVAGGDRRWCRGRYGD